ncbi:MAG: hypothetical protein ABI140_02330 [Jatrophihabitantaceae bacterium]
MLAGPVDSPAVLGRWLAGAEDFGLVGLADTEADTGELGAALLAEAGPVERAGAAVQPVTSSSNPAQPAAIILMSPKTARAAG